MALLAERVFEADRERIGAMTSFVIAQAESRGLPPRRLLHLELALEEALVNICTYAYREPPREVTIRLLEEGSRFSVELIDEGIPFDPLEEAPTPDLTADLDGRAVGGLGVLLIRRVTDEVHYRREGSRNVLALVLKGEA
jgi:anti-sigma regulatory factor (Ser/Thr protein kinase)